MVTMEARSDMIRAVTEQEIPDCVQVIRESFQTVADTWKNRSDEKKSSKNEEVTAWSFTLTVIPVPMKWKRC